MAQFRPVRQAEQRRRGDSATFARIAPAAPYLSQLLAADRPRARVAGRPERAAASAYDSTAARAVRRLPPGYRTSIET